jgi:hypothetical protein
MSDSHQNLCDWIPITESDRTPKNFDGLLTSFVEFRQSLIKSGSKSDNRIIRSWDALTGAGEDWKFLMTLFKIFLVSRDFE